MTSSATDATGWILLTGFLYAAVAAVLAVSAGLRMRRNSL